MKLQTKNPDQSPAVGADKGLHCLFCPICPQNR